LDPAPLEILEHLLLTPGTFSFRTEEPKPEDLPSLIGLDPQSHVHRFLGGFPSTNGKKCPIQKHRIVLRAQGPFPRELTCSWATSMRREMLCGEENAP